jgi:hypothetical protein
MCCGGRLKRMPCIWRGSGIRTCLPVDTDRPGRNRVVAMGPIATIRPPSTTTVWSASTRSPSIADVDSRTLACGLATPPRERAASAQAGMANSSGTCTRTARTRQFFRRVTDAGPGGTRGNVADALSVQERSPLLVNATPTRYDSIQAPLLRLRRCEAPSCARFSRSCSSSAPCRCRLARRRRRSHSLRTKRTSPRRFRRRSRWPGRAA